MDVAGPQEPFQRLDQANAPTLPELLLALPQDDETFERFGAVATGVSVVLIHTSGLRSQRGQRCHQLGEPGPACRHGRHAAQLQCC